MPPTDEERREKRRKNRERRRDQRARTRVDESQTWNPTTTTTTRSNDDLAARYAPTAWSGNSGQGEFTELTCPSGQMCLVRRPGVRGLMKAGVLHSVDALSVAIDNGIRKGTGQRPQDEAITLKAITENPSMLEDALHMSHRILCYVVVAPVLEMPRDDPTNRKPGVLYADDVDEMDMMFIINFVMGGSKELETFRERFEENLRSLDAQSANGSTSE